MSVPEVYHVVAMSRNRVIGKNNKLPWHFPEDLKHFKQLTTGSTVIMGRKTFDSIGRALPNRANFILSRQLLTSGRPAELLPSFSAETVKSMLEDRSGNVRFFETLEAALEEVKTPEAYIIGGAELYRETLGAVQGLYVTRIDADYEGDAFYPEIPADFEEVEIQNLREANPRIDAIFYEHT